MVYRNFPIYNGFAARVIHILRDACVPSRVRPTFWNVALKAAVD